MTAKQKKNCLKMKNFLETVYESGKLQGLTQLEIKSCVDIYNDLIRGDEFSATILYNVAEKFRKCGFTVNTMGIGYSISLQVGTWTKLDASSL